MGDDADVRLSEIENRLGHVEKELEAHEALRPRDRKELRRDLRHVRQWVLGLWGGITVIFAGSAALIGLVHIGDRSEFTQFKEDMEKEVRGFSGVPKVALTSLDGSNLSEKTLVINVFPTPPGVPPNNLSAADLKTFPKTFSFSFITKNEGDAASGVMWYKLYTDDSLKSLTKPTDEQNKGYTSEFVAGASDLHIPEIPGGGFSVYTQLHFPITNDNPVLIPYHKALIKIYYGGGRHSDYEIKLATSRAP
ncbi:MAG TPA: hypothetical protein VGG27_18815 [Magnetospirillaceae bacterium]|jgi:hypothetical protein